MTAHADTAVSLSPTHDSELAARVTGGEHATFEALMRRYNARLFRVARAILRADAEAEDALPDAYLDAFRHIGGFRGGAALGTWLTRLRRRRRERVVVPFAGRANDAAAHSDLLESTVADEQTESPPSAVLRAEVRRLLERRIDDLRVAFRAMFAMRDVEDMTVQETAACLSVPEATVAIEVASLPARQERRHPRGLSGAAFDKAYVDHALAYHQAVIDALDKTLIPGAKNAELKALLVKMRPAFVAHLEHARSIQSSLGKSICRADALGGGAGAGRDPVQRRGAGDRAGDAHGDRRGRQLSPEGARDARRGRGGVGEQGPVSAHRDVVRFDSKVIEAGKSWSYTPKARGEVPYHCTLHPTMTGMLRIR